MEFNSILLILICRCRVRFNLRDRFQESGLDVQDGQPCTICIFYSFLFIFSLIDMVLLGLVGTCSHMHLMSLDF